MFNRNCAETILQPKDELILTVLRHYDERFRNFFMRAVEANTDNPKDRLLVVFDVAEKWFDQKNFYGCICVVGGSTNIRKAGQAKSAAKVLIENATILS